MRKEDVIDRLTDPDEEQGFWMPLTKVALLVLGLVGLGLLGLMLL